MVDNGGVGVPVVDSPAIEGDNVAEEEQPDVQEGAVDVFVSYRIDPDQPTAVALRRLVEGSIEPTPRVFVSGAGGIRPSNIGLRPQLHQAVRHARVFLALITPHSKEREWVIFEAGAAWGRDQLYAPILVDTEAHEVGTTIADYVATKADVREQMESLVHELAKSLGRSVKSHFGTRFSAFERHLEQRRRNPKQVDPSSEGGALSRALQLWFAGNKAEALRAFEEAEKEAQNDEDLADAQILRLSVQTEEDKERFRQELAQLDEKIRSTASWVVWSGIMEKKPHAAIELYDRALRLPSIKPDDFALVVRSRAEHLFSLARDDEATTFLMHYIASGSPAHRVLLVNSLWEHCKRLGSFAKLMLGAWAIADSDSDLFMRLAELGIAENWPCVAIYAARNYRRKADSNSAMNTLGRAYHACRYFSLAHDAYREAIAAGASVAKVNVALCLGYNAVPAAGLALLKEHVGDFDSAAPAFPFRTRADLEDLVSSEQTKANKFSSQGRKLFLMLAELADSSSAETSSGTSDQTIEAIDSDGRAMQLSILYPFPRILEARLGEIFYGLFRQTAQDPSTYRGVRFNPIEELEPTWEILRRHSPDVVPRTGGS